MKSVKKFPRAETVRQCRHFIDLLEIPAPDLRMMLDYAANLKRERHHGVTEPNLRGCKLAMIFEKNSTRTRVSFEVAMVELGGYPIYLNGNDMQLGRGETVADTARVLSRYVDGILLRCNSHDDLLELANYSTVPVINALSDLSHPCQVMADVLTFEEHRGSIADKIIAWVGDGNNVCHSWISAAAKFGFTLRIATPRELQPHADYLKQARTLGAKVEICATPEEAAAGADALSTDTWVSMGDENAEKRRKLLAPFQVNRALMDSTATGAVFLHCLPAHRGEEVTEDVIDGPASVVWDEAENRLHVQKAILLWCMRMI